MYVRMIVFAMVLALACPVPHGIAADIKVLPGLKKPPVQQPAVDRLPPPGTAKPPQQKSLPMLRTIAVQTPLTAVGGRPTPSGTSFPLKTIGVQTSLSAVGPRVAPSGVSFPMKTISVPTPLDATGPR